ncbi:MAG: penicillin acylase family protein, partial [Chloroflexi bacterium]|nr:penicillin acylase family protein [Chloroflexota bacterium]
PAAQLTNLLAQLGSAAGVARAAWITLSHGADPVLSGRLPAPGARAPIELLRDTHGVPHVFAQSEADALYGQGFVHAQDRLFQMEAMRRLAAGRLAEAAGPALLDSDRFMRRLGLERLAASDLAATTAENRELLDAYVAGVNAGIASLPALPPEFALLGPPAAWRAEDSMLVGRLILFGFAGNWDTELLRERLLAELGPAGAASVDGSYPTGATTHLGVPSPASVEQLLSAYHAAYSAGVVSGASNAWALAPSRTNTGAPLLAADPHLETRLPPVFHVSHLSGGVIDAAGADLPGTPGIALGHNRTLAWGITAGMADVADCYVETIDPAHPDRYLTPDGWALGVTRQERIDVCGREPAWIGVLETRHGVVIGAALAGDDRAIALRSTALEPGDIVTPFLGVLTATRVDEFEAALDQWPSSPFNWVFAHVDGTIGYRLAGGVPERPPGVGLLPQHGPTSPGPPPLIAPARLPRLVNPASGVIVSANHAPGGNLDLGGEWCEPWRADRIAHLLYRRAQHDVASCATIQLDVHSEPLARLRDRLLSAHAVADPALRALLSAWDGQASASSAAAAFMETMFRTLATELATRLAGPVASILLGAGVGNQMPHSTFRYRLHGWVLERLELPAGDTALAEWWPDPGARDRTLAHLAERVRVELGDRLGTDPTRWSWGALHTIEFAHPLRAIPGIGQWFSRGPYPSGGDVNTVCQSGFSMHHGMDVSGFTPVYRQVIDLADFDRSCFMLAGGNSGIPGHARYDDTIDEYLGGLMRPLLTSRAAVDAAAEHALVLEPA